MKRGEDEEAARSISTRSLSKTNGERVEEARFELRNLKRVGGGYPSRKFGLGERGKGKEVVKEK